MKKLLLLLIIFIFIQQIYSKDIKSYEVELIKFYESADHNKEAVGFTKFSNGIAGCAPNCFTITNEDTIYICDACNYRIAIYDLKFTYLGEIKKRDIIYADRIKVTSNNGIYLQSDNYEIFKLNSHADIIYTAFGNQLSMNIFEGDNFYPIDNYLFFYDKSNELRIIDEKGKIQDTIQAKAALQQIFRSRDIRNFENEEKSVEINNYIAENNLLCIDNKIFHPDFEVYKKYFQFRKSLNEDKKASESGEEINISSLELHSHLFLGYDSDNNIYWSAVKKISFKGYDKRNIVIIVFNPNGNVLDYFQLDLEYPNVCVSSSGDIYYMISDIEVDGVAFYKVARCW